MANKTAGKRYYWLRQRDDFFNTLRMKKLRRMENGDTLLIIYQKMLLKAMKSEGELTYSGVEPDLAGELAIEFDEDVENVRRTLEFLGSCGLAELTGGGCLLPEAVENTGCEGASAQRMRDKRAREREAAPVTSRAQCDASVTPALRSRDGEIEIEKEKEKRDREEIKEREKIREKVLTGEETSPSRPCLPAGNVSFDNSAGKYGEYRNVLLSDGEADKLREEFPDDWRQRVERLSEYMASTGKGYRNHLATIRAWARRDAPKEEKKNRYAGMMGETVV